MNRRTAFLTATAAAMSAAALTAAVGANFGLLGFGRSLSHPGELSPVGETAPAPHRPPAKPRVQTVIVDVTDPAVPVRGGSGADQPAGSSTATGDVPADSPTASEPPKVVYVTDPAPTTSSPPAPHYGDDYGDDHPDAGTSAAPGSSASATPEPRDD